MFKLRRVALQRIFCAVLALGVCLQPLSVNAISQSALNSIKRGTAAYDPTLADQCSTTQNGQGDGYGLTAPNLADPSILATAINDYIKDLQPNSPMNGLGDKFVSGAMRSNINPLVLVAHAQFESSFGTSNLASNGSNNAFGRTATADQPHVTTNRMWYKYDSFADSLDGRGLKDDQPAFIKRVYVDSGLTSLDAYLNKYAPPTENNTNQYLKNMQDLMKKFVTQLAPGAFASPGTSPSDIAGSGSCSGPSSVGGTVVQIAERELALGAHESDHSYYKYTENNADNWCAWFVSWVFRAAGKPFTGGRGQGGYAYPVVGGMMDYAKEKQWFHPKGEVGFSPQPGDVAIYKEGVDPYRSHVNIVISYDGHDLYEAIGGNEGNAIHKGSHSITSPSLSGFMRVP